MVRPAAPEANMKADQAGHEIDNRYNTLLAFTLHILPARVTTANGTNTYLTRIILYGPCPELMFLGDSRIERFF